MEPADRLVTDNTVTPYELAMGELKLQSSGLAQALRARSLEKGPIPEEACIEAHRVYDKMIDLFSKLQLDESQRITFLQELGVLRVRIDECAHIGVKGKER